MSINKIVSRKWQEEITTSPAIKTADGQKMHLPSIRRKSVDAMECVNCGHVYERAGLDGFFAEMFEGCPKCGHGKTEQYDDLE